MIYAICTRYTNCSVVSPRVTSRACDSSATCTLHLGPTAKVINVYLPFGHLFQDMQYSVPCLITIYARSIPAHAFHIQFANRPLTVSMKKMNQTPPSCSLSTSNAPTQPCTIKHLPSCPHSLRSVILLQRRATWAASFFAKVYASKSLFLSCSATYTSARTISTLKLALCPILSLLYLLDLFATCTELCYEEPDDYFLPVARYH